MPFPTDWSDYLGISSDRPYWERTPDTSAISPFSGAGFLQNLAGLVIPPNADPNTIMRAIGQMGETERQDRLWQMEQQKARKAARQYQAEQHFNALVGSGKSVEEALGEVGTAMFEHPLQYAQALRYAQQTTPPKQQYRSVTVDGNKFLEQLDIHGRPMLRPFPEEKQSSEEKSKISESGKELAGLEGELREKKREIDREVSQQYAEARKKGEAKAPSSFFANPSLLREARQLSEQVEKKRVEHRALLEPKETPKGKKTLTDEEAQKFWIMSGRNKEKATELARAAGYDI